MTPYLSISLLGPLEIRFNDEPLSGFEYNKVRALLAYLAVESGKPQSRGNLCTLLWPELPENAARQDLSQALTHLRKVLRDKQADVPYLLATTNDIQLNPEAACEMDVPRFSTLISEAEAHFHRGWRLCSSCYLKLRQAAGLYRGDFLAQFYLGDSAPFEEWALLLRERLRLRMLSALERMARYEEWRGAYAKAAETAWRRIELEPLHDEAQRDLMRLLALSGQRAAALAQYESLRRTLQAELGLEPEAETTALFEQIHAGDSLEALRRFRPLFRRLPAPAAELVGRLADLEAVQRLLLNGTRLLTVTGAPGIGKTRLALEAAHRLLYDFEDGACFVELAPLPNATQVPSALARALGVKGQPGRALEQALHGYLQSRHILLVIDNFEHVMEAAPFVAELLAGSPAVKVLVTSRAALHLRAEQQYTLEPLPEAEAVQLFAERAQAAHPGFAITPQNSEIIANLCRQLDDLPLGIELAAVNAETFSPGELLKQLGRRLEAFPYSFRDLPERQSNLRNAIAWSFDRLSPNEQRIFRHLGVFAGGCTVEAVQAVIGNDRAEDGPAVPILLEALVEASLVQLQSKAGAARFTLLETIREFALEQLTAQGEAEAARCRHAEYFLALAEQTAPELLGSDQKAWFDRLDDERANLRQALAWS